jgi:hypothetical protein
MWVTYVATGLIMKESTLLLFNGYYLILRVQREDGKFVNIVKPRRRRLSTTDWITEDFSM